MRVDDLLTDLPRSALVIGAGLMGTQIGLEYAVAGVHTTLCARDPAAVRARVEETLKDLPRGVRPRADDVAVVADPLEAAPVDVVVESLPEDLGLKAAVLARAAGHHRDALFLTNTSSLPVGEIARQADLIGRLVGTHYWNPPLLMPLVELVVPEGVEDGTAQRVQEILRALGKRPIRVSDSPGFAWNRLQFALLREAAALTREGVITPEDLDVVVRDGLALRWRAVGPFETMALGGVSTFSRIADNLYPILATDRASGDLADNEYLDETSRRTRAEERDAYLRAQLTVPRER